MCDQVSAATYMRIGKTRYRWEFRLRPGETADHYHDMDRLHPLLAPWTKDISIDALRIVRVAEYTFRAQIADRWREGRVFILGDAAHLTPPFIGQGMGAGLRDDPAGHARRQGHDRGRPTGQSATTSAGARRHLVPSYPLMSSAVRRPR